jgi:hypothetical protein
MISESMVLRLGSVLPWALPFNRGALLLEMYKESSREWDLPSIIRVNQRSGKLYALERISTAVFAERA